MTTTVGKLEPPFGKTRLQVMKMFSAILLTNSDDVNEELAKLGTLQAMWVSCISINKRLARFGIFARFILWFSLDENLYRIGLGCVKKNLRLITGKLRLLILAYIV